MRFECVSYVLRCAFTRRLPIQLRFPYAQMCFRSTAVNPNAFSMCSSVLSPDICRSKRVFYMLKCALARRSSIQTRFLCSQMCSRWTLLDPNAFIFGKVYLDLSMAHFRMRVPSHPGTTVEKGLIQIWTKKCPNENIRKQIWCSFGRVHLGLKMA